MVVAVPSGLTAAQSAYVDAQISEARRLWDVGEPVVVPQAGPVGPLAADDDAICSHEQQWNAVLEGLPGEADDASVVVLFGFDVVDRDSPVPLMAHTCVSYTAEDECLVDPATTSVILVDLEFSDGVGTDLFPRERLLAHEIGHAAGLWHPFDRLCDPEGFGRHTVMDLDSGSGNVEVGQLEAVRMRLGDEMAYPYLKDARSAHPRLDRVSSIPLHEQALMVPEGVALFQSANPKERDGFHFSQGPNTNGRPRFVPTRLLVEIEEVRYYIGASDAPRPPLVEMNLSSADAPMSIDEYLTMEVCLLGDVGCWPYFEGPVEVEDDSEGASSTDDVCMSMGHERPCGRQAHPISDLVDGGCIAVGWQYECRYGNLRLGVNEGIVSEFEMRTLEGSGVFDRLEQMLSRGEVGSDHDLPYMVLVDVDSRSEPG